MQLIWILTCGSNSRRTLVQDSAVVCRGALILVIVSSHLVMLLDQPSAFLQIQSLVYYYLFLRVRSPSRHHIPSCLIIRRDMVRVILVMLSEVKCG